MMTIRLLSLSDRGGEEISVSFALQSGEYIEKKKFLLSTTQVADLGLRVGDCERECYDAVEYAAKLHFAIKRALTTLGYGSCSEKMLCRKLVMKGVERGVAEDAVAELCERGLLDSSASAVREVEKCIAKLWGRRRIVATLYEKGYSDRTIKEALSVLAEVDEVELCVKRLEKQASEIPTDPTERKKLIASLERYGFSSAQIREAFVRILESK